MQEKVKNRSSIYPLLFLLILMTLFAFWAYKIGEPRAHSFYADSDEGDYYHMALQMARGEGFTISKSHGNFNSLVYALFFRFLDPSFSIVIIINIIFIALCFPLIYGILGNFKVPPYMRVLSLGLIVNPYVLKYSTMMLSEAGFTFLLCLTMYLYGWSLRTHKWWLCALAAAVLYYSRSVGLLMIGGLFISVFWLALKGEVKKRAPLIFGIVVFLVLIPEVTLRYQKFGSPFFNSGSFQFYVDDYSMRDTPGVDIFSPEGHSRLRRNYLETHTLADMIRREMKGLIRSPKDINHIFGSVLGIPLLGLTIGGLLVASLRKRNYALAFWVPLILYYVVLAWLRPVQGGAFFRKYVPFLVLYLPFSIFLFDIRLPGKRKMRKIWKVTRQGISISGERVRFVSIIAFVYLVLWSQAPSIRGVYHQHLNLNGYQSVFWKIHRYYLDNVDPEHKTKVMLRQGYVEGHPHRATPNCDIIELVSIIEKEKVDYLIVNNWGPKNPTIRGILSGEIKLPETWALIVEIQGPFHLKMFSLSGFVEREAQEVLIEQLKRAEVDCG